ncbi:putative bifunctional diguanylate cyclase/phosphodiesterase [Catenuloplanes indicus]|uniref:Diguanylate cyclase (GGDEF)-like protein n=1 Tax=Catenuloplanes indicus TaxID=137267 RepID=A0AAE3W1A4_9ACTN|nr:bifunctional diguanylate cyclase/phosphodiesterase [Catenuloplanes indicus]MDQ0367490.1 diguanylate cyclase (GGDEF)-like protein [Catenuloplanes indicus]
MSVGTGAVVRPFRPTPQIVAAIVLTVAATTWCVAGMWHVWSVPVLGWLPLPVLGVLAAYECRAAARAPGAGPAVRRFWAAIAVASAFVFAGSVSMGYDSTLAGAEPTRTSPRSALIFAAGLIAVYWGLLRLPSRNRTGGERLRFALDAGVIVVTVALFGWHFSLRHIETWRSSTGSDFALIAIVAVAAVALVAFVKVALTGTGGVDPHALHLLAIGTFGSAATAALSPALATRPYLNGCMLAVPIAYLSVILAADRQRRAPGTRAEPVLGRIKVSLVPYIAVLAAGGLLVHDRLGGPSEPIIIAVTFGSLTALVMVRQLTVLRENARLLATVDANLAALRSAWNDLDTVQTQLAHQASHDALTNLANRALLAARVDAATADGERFAVLLIDLNDFKAVNDWLGHAAGDRLLEIVAERLLHAVRTEDTVARLGGDEFAVLMPGLDAASAGERCAEIAARVQRPVVIEGHQLEVSAGIGLADNGNAATGADVLRRADVAMYVAKAKGAVFVGYHPDMDQIAAEEARLAADLRQAIERQQLHLLYQPVVELPTGRTVRVEALMRWRHPTEGMVPPDRFIAIAERSGTIDTLGEWALREVCRQIISWRTVDRVDVEVNVNVSARQLRSPGFPDLVTSILAEYGVAPSSITLEITETAVFDGGPAVESLRTLRGLGFRVALDDFGTGHSSLSLLTTCPVDVIKVDKSFVAGIGGHGQQAVIVTALIQITAGLNLHAVAEGVETADQASRLHALGYRFAQGYYFDRPLPADDVVSRFRVAAL